MGKGDIVSTFFGSRGVNLWPCVFNRSSNQIKLPGGKVALRLSNYVAM